MTEIAVVVPTLKQRDEIACIRELERQSFDDYEVIVRDDDRATTARNEGIKQATADKIVFLDDDSRPADGYLSRASTLLDSEAAVAGKVVHPREDVIKRLTGHYAPADTQKYVTRFVGCNVAMRREVFETVGMWDENITWGHEEKELAERVLREYPIRYDPELVAYHPYADSIPDYWKKAYLLDKQMPYLWEKSGVSERKQWLNIVEFAINPINYAGFTPRHLAARAGGSLARTAGRIHGMVSKPDVEVQA